MMKLAQVAQFLCRSNGALRSNLMWIACLSRNPIVPDCTNKCQLEMAKDPSYIVTRSSFRYGRPIRSLSQKVGA
jgi:hypothetical protein